jgi:hypothetical protein
MKRWQNIIEAPGTQYERFYMMIRLINDINDKYKGDLLIPNSDGRIVINRDADNGRSTTGYSRSIIIVTSDQHQYKDKWIEENWKRHQDIRLAELIAKRFNRLDEKERSVIISRYLDLKGKEKIKTTAAGERQYFRIKRKAEFHLIFEWGLNIYSVDGLLRGRPVEEENDAFYYHRVIPRNSALLGVPRRCQ